MFTFKKQKQCKTNPQVKLPSIAIPGSSAHELQTWIQEGNNSASLPGCSKHGDTNARIKGGIPWLSLDPRNAQLLTSLGHQSF